MDIQTHTRTQQIKRLSRYLLIALNGVRFLMYLGWPGIIFIAVYAEGHLPLGDNRVFVEKSDYLLKGLILPTYAVALVIMLRINQEFRGLMKQYINGHIFSDEAIGCVKTALKAVIAYILVYFLQALIGLIYNSSIGAATEFSPVKEIIIPLIFIGLMFTLLWALEIGRDLNEESEGTI
jgi:hypothetical protein